VSFLWRLSVGLLQTLLRLFISHCCSVTFAPLVMMSCTIWGSGTRTIIPHRRIGSGKRQRGALSGATLGFSGPPAFPQQISEGPIALQVLPPSVRCQSSPRTCSVGESSVPCPREGYTMTCHSFAHVFKLIWKLPRPAPICVRLRKESVDKFGSGQSWVPQSNWCRCSGTRWILEYVVHPRLRGFRSSSSVSPVRPLSAKSP